MALVHYSDSESESDTEQLPQKRGLSSLLPPPKKTKTIHIEAPRYLDDEDDQPSKPLKTTVGLGLADLLPAPKHYKGPTPVTKSNTAFMPHALAKKIKNKEPGKEEESKKVELKQEEEPLEEEEEEEVTPAHKKYTGSFFKIGKELKEEAIVAPTPKSLQATPGPIYSVERAPEEPQMAAVDAYAYDPNAMYSSDPSVYYQYQQEVEEETVGNLDDGEDLHKMVGKRLRGESNIQIKTINQADMLPSKEWRDQQALTAAPKFNSGISMQASKAQMKKNNIMALAAHAVNNQDKLDEMFAANKKTRRDASKKYGF